MDNMRYVAFLDILGFSQLVENSSHTHEQIANKMADIFQCSILSALRGKQVIVEKIPNLNISNKIKILQFSDSVILFTKGDSQVDFNNMVLCLNYLLAQALVRGYPLRGGLSIGQLYYKHPILVSDGLIKAYRFEGKQAWSGVIIDRICYERENIDLQKVIEPRKLVSYEDVPIKSDHSDCLDKHEKHYVINWPLFIGERMPSEKEIVDNFSQNNDSPRDSKAEIILQETVRFGLKNMGYEYLPTFKYNETGKKVLLLVRTELSE